MQNGADMCIVHIVKDRTSPIDLSSNDLIFWWDDVKCKDFEYSIQAWCEKNFLTLRREFNDFVYDLGLSSINGQNLYKWLCAGDRLSMWWCSLIFEKHPVLMPEVFEILKLRSLEYMLAKFSPNCTKIIFHGNDSILIRTLKKYCANCNIKFVAKKSQSNFQIFNLNNNLFSFYKFLWPQLRAFLRLLWWFFSTYLLLPSITLNSAQKKSVTIVSYFPHACKDDEGAGHYTSPYWGNLPQIINGKKNINWLFMRINCAHISLRNAVKQLKQFNDKQYDGASFHFVEQFLNINDIWQVIIRYLKLSIISHKLEKNVAELCCFKHSKMNIWFYIKASYRESFQGWICLERALQRKAMLNYATWAKEQEWTIFPLENCPWERMLTEALHHARVGNIYGAQHSVLRRTDLRYFDSVRIFGNPDTQVFLPHKILVNGQQAYNCLHEAEMPLDNVLIVEALRYLHLLELSNKNDVSQQNANLIVVTSFFSDAAHAHIKLLAQWLAKYGAVHDWNIYIKAHPFCPIESIVKRYISPTHEVTVVTKDMHALLDEFSHKGAIFWLANDTSVMIEVMYLGLPFFVQGAQKNSLNLCALQGIDALQYVYTCEEVQVALQNKQVLNFDAKFFLLDVSLKRWLNVLAIA